MKKPTYIKCPRCELNYIKSTDRYCPVCMAELKLAGEPFGGIGDDEELELCPVCGQNFISQDQKMCEDCKRQNEYEDEMEDIDEKDNSEQTSIEEWEDEEASSDDGDVELVPLSSLADEEDFDDDDESEEEDSDRITCGNALISETE